MDQDKTTPLTVEFSSVTTYCWNGEGNDMRRETAGRGTGLLSRRGRPRGWVPSSFTGIKPWLPTTGDGWLAGALFQACPAPTSQQAHHHLRCSSSANAATGGTTTLMHNSCLAAPTCSTSSLVQHQPTKLPHGHVGTFHLWVREGAWRPLTAPPAGRGTFCKHANLAGRPSCVQWRRDPAP